MNRNRVAATQARPFLEPLEPRLLLHADAGQQALELFSVSPALFVENQGQWADPAVRFVHNGDGANVAMTDSGPVFQVFRQVPREGAGGAPEGEMPPGLGPDLPDPERYDTQVLQFSASFLGASAVAPVGLAPSEARFNYFVGDQANWQSDVPAYEQVAYLGLYDGIDLVTWGQRDSLKYEFHVAPGADWSQIAVRYEGIAGLGLAEDGSLRVSLGGLWGEVLDDAPYAYQVIGDQRVAVAASFAILDGTTYGFSITGAYDPTRELVIDPDLAYCTYLGGSSSDTGWGIAVDGAGNAYVTGQTSSTGLATPGAYQTTYIGDASYDAFVAKFSSTGSGLVYCTYLGGSGGDIGYGIAVDGAGNAYVTGQTFSTGLGTPGAYRTTLGGNWDAFVAKFNSTGSGLAYFTYLGYRGTDYGYGIAVDGSGNAYVTGYTNSSGLATPGAYQTTFYGYHAFVAKLNSTGSGLAYCTYLGGGGGDLGRGIAVDGSGNAYVTGRTSSTGLATAGAYQTTYGGTGDAFVAKLSSTGSGLAYCTYLGGSGSEQGFGITVDGSGNAYVTGGTSSTGMATPGAYQTTYGGGSDAFVAVFNSTGSGLVYCTYLGGSSYDYGYGIAVDGSGNVYVTGKTTSTGLATPGAYQTTYGGSGDAFVAVFDLAPPHLNAVSLNGRPGRTVSSGEPSGIGVTRIFIAFSETVNLTGTCVQVNIVTFPGGVEVLDPALLPLTVDGSGSSAMTITFASGAVMDTWVKVRISAANVADGAGNALDGEPASGGSGHGYIYSASTDLPTGDGAAGGDAVFYVGSLRGDFNGDLSVGPDDLEGFATAWGAKSLDADFRGVGFGPRPPDGRVTLSDIDGFTAVYQRALATNLHLDELPGTGSGQAAGFAQLSSSSLPANQVDVLVAAAGRVQAAPAGLLQAAAGEIPLAGFGSALAATDSKDNTAAGEPDGLAVKRLRPVRPSSASLQGVLRI